MKYSFIYTVCQEARGGQGQQTAKLDTLAKNMGYLRYSCLRTDNHSPGGRVGSQKLTLTLEALAPARQALPRPLLGKDIELKFPLFSQEGL